MIRQIVFCSVLMISGYAGAQPKIAVKTGENAITLSGERFHSEKIMLKPNGEPYDNLWFDNGTQRFTDINLIGKYDDRYVNFQLRFPGQIGTYTIEDNRNDTGSQNNNNNCYLTVGDKGTSGDGMGGQPGSVKVIVTRYDSVGGLIEGTFTGALIEGRNNNTITISGNFSFIRQKNRKGF
jgi:hypothetical protein